jgi:ABC-type proline/glycine betaine transport system ATPase subunit
MDEPFSSLDPRTAEFLRSELKQLQENLGMTTVFVTHDLVEAEQLADRIAVIREGVVGMVAKPIKTGSLRRLEWAPQAP